MTQAKAALDAIPAGSVEGSAKGQLAELKRHMAALSRASATAAAETSAPASAQRGSASNANWATEVAAMGGKLLADLHFLGSGSAGSATADTKTPAGASATGTSAAARPPHPAGTTGSKESSAKSSPSLDEADPGAADRSAHASHRVCGSEGRGRTPRVEAQRAPRRPVRRTTPSASSASSTTGMSASTEQGAGAAQTSTGSQSGAAALQRVQLPGPQTGASQASTPAAGTASSDPAAGSGYRRSRARRLMKKPRAVR